MKLSLLISLLMLIISAPFSITHAQNPFENPKNLKVLPENIPPGQLRSIMRNFSFAMGERCSYCHVNEVTDEGDRMVFDADDKEEKRIAREMLKLVGTINQSINDLNRGDDHQYTRVQCMTCHRKQANPFLIEQVMNEAIKDGGIAAAQSKYLELKEKYYGGHTYDFTGFTLAEYANSLNSDENSDNALEMAKFGVNNYPNEPYAHTVLGDVYLKRENYKDAIKAYAASLKVNPDQDFIRNKLEDVKKMMK